MSIWDRARKAAEEAAKAESVSKSSEDARILEEARQYIAQWCERMGVPTVTSFDEVYPFTDMADNDRGSSEWRAVRITWRMEGQVFRYGGSWPGITVKVVAYCGGIETYRNRKRRYKCCPHEAWKKANTLEQLAEAMKDM